MKKSLFTRMLLVYLLIILISFTLLGGIFFSTLRNNYLDMQMDAMIENAHEINVWYTDYCFGGISEAAFEKLLIEKATSEDTTIWLTDRSEQMVTRIADPQDKDTIEETFSSKSVREFCQLTGQGNYVKKVSDVDQSFRSSVISIAVPLIAGNEPHGTIIVHREVEAFGVGINSIIRQILLPLVFAVAFAFMLVFILSRYIVRPINEIAYAAGELSRGNLDWRVKSRTEDELGQLSDAFNKMAEELKLQNSMKNTFIANVSHELRTPLASTQGFIQGMLDRAIDEVDRDKYLEIVLSETKRMNALITDLLSLAKIESGQFPIELSEFDINELVRRCIIVFEQRIEDKNLQVDIRLSEEKMKVWADEDRISQVVTNLIDNAVKFSQDGGELKIWTSSEGNKVFVHVADSGEGIAEEEQPYIFERFYKVDKSHSRNKPGTGIGLSIVKHIISQHGEKITVDSAPGKGATFTFTLTKAAEEPRQEDK